MLHRSHGTLATERHAESLLHGSLLIGRPMGMYLTLARQRILLHKFQNFSRRRTGIRIRAGESGINCAEGESFIAQQKLFCFHIMVLGKILMNPDFSRTRLYGVRKSERLYVTLSQM